ILIWKELLLERAPELVVVEVDAVVFVVVLGVKAVDVVVVEVVEEAEAGVVAGVQRRARRNGFQLRNLGAS
ncbi:hypothetical protein MQA17_25560, partial [Escherichia coli]|nr:hypothetical protein [Escherichia coli]